MASLYFNLPLPDEQSIRLLTLLPGATTAKIQCILQVVDLSLAPTYEALSYVWGSQDSPTRIICNEIPIRVGPNLAAALQRIRLESRSRVLWIDALCIDQSNLKERSPQVALMQDIYQRASGILMWLGNDEDGNVEAALSLIDKAANLARQEAVSPIPRPEEIKVEVPSLEKNMSRDFPAPQDPSWEALVQLFRRPYFECIWILQEVYQAVSITTFVGDQQRVLNEFGLAVHWFVYKSYAAMILRFARLMRVYLLW